MNINNLSIRTKLYGGFIIVLLFTISVGIISYLSISKISYQDTISQRVSNILNNVGEAQAATLRFLYYNDESFYKIADEKIDNVIA